VLEITIPTAPATKKNSQRIVVDKATGCPFVMQSEKYKDYEAFCVGTLKRPGWLMQWGNIQFTKPVHLCARYWLPDNRKRDLLNLLAATADILQKAGLIADDTLIVRLDGSRKMGVDKMDPRVELTLTEEPPF